MESHTFDHFRDEVYISDIVNQETRESWLEKGEKGMLEKAREEARKILAEHRPVDLDPKLLQELDAYVRSTEARTLDDFYAAEWEG
jgi:trimethylamine--corrinoid protein Co-methyltransferase